MNEIEKPGSSHAVTEKRIRICHMLVLPHLTGVQRSTLDICQRLDPERYECHVICKNEGELTERLEEAGLAFHLVPSLDRALNPINDFLAFWKIWRICRKQKFDLVHTHSSKTGILGRIGARLAGVPCVVHHVRGFSFHEYSGKLTRILYSRIEQVAAWFCDKVIFVNDEERVMSVENRWIAPEKCVTIYNGADLDLYDSEKNEPLREAFRKEKGLGDNEIAILVSGRFYPQKQPLILPKIASCLDAMNPDLKWRFLLAGEGDLEEQLREQIRETGMERRVEIIGWYSNPHQLTAGVDAMLLASLWEGLPRVLIEAQAAGLPIVVSDINGNREVVTRETGFLCEPKDPASYAQALFKLCSDASIRQQMSVAARSRAEQEFDAKQTFAKILGLYEELLQRREGDPDSSAG